MGRTIVLQPNGLFAEWSSVVDDIVVIDETVEDIIADRVKEYTKRVTKDINKICDELKNNGKPYCQFTMTWGDVIKETKQRYGNDSEQMEFLKENGLLGK